MTEQKDNIFTAINKIMEQVGYVKKQRGANLNYTYAGEAALISALRPEMVENGVFCHVAAINNVTTREYRTANDKAMVNVTLTATIRFIHAPSGTSIDVVACGEGSDTGDKATNKAMTGAYKYALRQTFAIETGDDPDRFQPAERKAEQPARAAAPVLTETNGNGHAPVEPPAAVDVLEAAKRMKTPKGAELNTLTLDQLKQFRTSIDTGKIEGKTFTPETLKAYDAAALLIANREAQNLKAMVDAADRD